MLSININKDVEQYQESVLAGFNAAQFIVIVFGVAAFAGTFALFHFVLHIPMMLCIYIALIPAIPIVLLGFGSKNGMSFFERMKRTLRRKKKPLFYESTETAAAYSKVEKKKCDEKEAKMEFEYAKKRMKRGILIMGIVIAACAGLLLFLKKSGIM